MKKVNIQSMIYAHNILFFCIIHLSNFIKYGVFLLLFTHFLGLSFLN